ncbi:MAG TPA: substrate-binding domain-containing protein [Azospirillum sp.]|nr:substrate-binding domain-containing protein [Azospirillum sp.]
MSDRARSRLSAACAALVAAGLLAGCQGPLFGGLGQTAALPPPPPPKRAEPEERGIWIVGSGAVEPRLRAVAAGYEGTRDTLPRVAAEGTVAGLRALCAGTGVESPDMALSDRRIRPDEARRCKARGIPLTEYELAPNQYVYVKDAHMAAIPGVREFVQSWGATGKPVTEPASGA